MGQGPRLTHAGVVGHKSSSVLEGIWGEGTETLRAGSQMTHPSRGPQARLVRSAPPTAPGGQRPGLLPEEDSPPSDVGLGALTVGMWTLYWGEGLGPPSDMRTSLSPQ